LQLHKHRIFVGLGYRSGGLKYPNKDLLYTTYEYPEFVPTITIKWEELAGVGG
jgi:hypothetical protein